METVKKTYALYSMEEGKIYRRRIPRLPPAPEKLNVQMQFGWLIMLYPQTNAQHEVDSSNDTQVSLINPASFERIDLPPIPSLPAMNPNSGEPYIPSRWRTNITSPPTNDDCIVFLNDRRNPFIIFCYLREKKWHVCNYESQVERAFFFFNIATLNGVVYGLTQYKPSLYQVIFSENQVIVKSLNVQFPTNISHGRKYFLVESKGVLYKVQSVEFLRTGTSKGFIIFKLDLSKMQWVMVSDIDDRVIFLDFVAHGFSCDANDQAGLKKNCIYYTNPYDPAGSNCIYQYSIEDRSVMLLRHDLRNIRKTRYSRPIWFSTQCIEEYLNLGNHNREMETINAPITDSAGLLSDNKSYTEKDLDPQDVQLPFQNICTSRQDEEAWSHLLPELVLQILHHLSYFDSRRVGDAIPRWLPIIRSSQKPIGPKWHQPCLFSFSNDYKTCRLTDPIGGTSHLFKSPGIPSTVKIESANHGWLLLMLSVSLLIFYNPMSNVVIELPDFKMSGIFSFSFSSPPTCPSCVVVAESMNAFSSRIMTCRKGDHEWTEAVNRMFSFEDDYEEYFQIEYRTAVVFRQKFHWLNSKGQIGVFDPISGAWDIYGEALKLPNTLKWYMVESDNELFWILATNIGDMIFVYKLDDSSYTWKKTEGLDGRCFFLSEEASIGGRASVFGYSEERLYFPMLQDEQFVYYSCKTHEVFPSGDFWGAKELLYNSCWIEPHWVEPSVEHTQWC